MKTVTLQLLLFFAAAFALVYGQTCEAALMGTAFTYQGRLIDVNEAADGLYDFQFTLRDRETGAQQGDPVYIDNNDVNVGYFTVKLDFGSDVFDGSSRCLEIGIRPGEQNDPCAYTVLEPRLEITPLPYALQTRGIFVDPNGNVGIGTTSPSERLRVIGTVKGTGGFATGDTTTLQDGWIRVYGLTPNDLIFKVGGSGPPTSTTQGTEIMRLTETGRLGIGTTNPTEALEVNGTAKANAFVGDGSELTNLPPTPDTDWTEVGGNVYRETGNVGIGTTSPGEKLEVNGNINVTGGQIIFPATQSASANVNTLDDYEEGTWVPGVSFGGGTTGILYPNRGGNYTKIGNVVTVSGTCLLSSKGSSTGAAQITGLPFTVTTNPLLTTGAVALFFEGITFDSQFQGKLDAGETTISLKQATEAGGISNLTDANFNDVSQVHVSATYRVE